MPGARAGSLSATAVPGISLTVSNRADKEWVGGPTQGGYWVRRPSPLAVSSDNKYQVTTSLRILLALLTY